MARRTSLQATKPQVKGMPMQRGERRMSGGPQEVRAYLGRADSSSSLLRTPSFT
jgi:hypothetical protein